VFHSRHESLDPHRPDTQVKLQKAFKKDDTVKKLEELLNIGSAQKKSVQSVSPSRQNTKEASILRNSAPVHPFKEETVQINRLLKSQQENEEMQKETVLLKVQFERFK